MNNNNAEWFDKILNYDLKYIKFPFDNCEKSLKKEFFQIYKKQEERFNIYNLENESKIENLTNTLNTKNSIIEDLYLRIKICKEEHDELLNICNNDKILIKDLEEKILQIKKADYLRIENLNNEIKEMKDRLHVRDYLETEILNIKEKYHSVCTELLSSKQKIENAEQKSEMLKDTIAKLNEELENKESDYKLLKQKKIEIENNLIKCSERYNFRLSKRFFRHHSALKVKGNLSKLSRKDIFDTKYHNKRKSSYFSESVSNNLFSFKISEDSNNQDICLNSNKRNSYSNTIRNYIKNTELEEIGNEENVLDQISFCEDFSEDNINNDFKEKNISGINNLNDDTLKKSRKSKKYEFKLDDLHPHIYFTEIKTQKKKTKQINKLEECYERHEMRERKWSSLAKLEKTISLKDIIDTDFEHYDSFSRKRELLKKDQKYHYLEDTERDKKEVLSDEILDNKYIDFKANKEGKSYINEN